MLQRREMRDGAPSAFVAIGALLSVVILRVYDKHVVALDADAVQALSAGRGRTVLVVVRVRGLLCLFGHGAILAQADGVAALASGPKNPKNQAADVRTEKP